MLMETYNSRHTLPFGNGPCITGVPCSPTPSSSTRRGSWAIRATLRITRRLSSHFMLGRDRALVEREYISILIILLQNGSTEGYYWSLINSCSLFSSRLAYAEMKLILARLLFNFDLTLAEESTGWMDNQKAYNLWSKPPLFMHLTPRQ